MGRRLLEGNSDVAIAYLRVSTEEQGLGPDAQSAQIEAWAQRVRIRVVATFSDHGVSGATPLAQRPGLLKAIDALRTERAGVLVAAKRDRLARDLVISALVDRSVRSVGAVVRTADGASDAKGPEGEMMRGIVDVFAAYEREVIRARTRAALAVKRTRGERIGQVPYGYRLAADGLRIEPDPVEQSVVQMVEGLRRDGLSHRAIVSALAETGAVSRAGRPFRQTQVARILASVNAAMEES